MTLEEATKQIETLIGDIKSRDETIKKLQDKNEEFEKKETARIEAERKAEKEKFENALKEKVDKGIVTPAHAKTLEKEFELLPEGAIEFENKSLSKTDFLLSRFEGASSLFETELDPSTMQAKIEGEIYNINTPEGKDKLDDYKEKKAKEYAAEHNIKDYLECYEMKSNEIDEKIKNGEAIS